MSDTPDNGWGQGAVNNSNGWGKGVANSSLGWGTIHPLTFGHPNTNLVGGSAFPTDGLDWSSFLPEFTSASVNSGSGLDFVAANGDYAQFNQTLTFTGDFTAQFIVSMNGGSRFIGLANGGQYIRTGNIDGKLNITFQLGGFINIPTLNNWGVGDIVDVTITRVGNQYTATTSLGTGATVTGITNDLRYDYLYRTGSLYYTGKIFKLKINSQSLSVDFNLLESNGNIFKCHNTGITATINGSTWLTGQPYGEQLYNWGWNKYTTGGVLDNTNGTVYITGDNPEAVNDINGNPIERPAVGFVDNAPAYSNHYRQIETVVNDTFDTSGDYSFMHWFKIPTGADGGYSVTNGSLVVRVDATNIYFSRDGGTTEITYAHNTDTFVFAAWLSLTNGTTDLWLGDLNNNPQEISTGLSAGTAAAGIQVMQMDNNHALSGRFNGHNTIAGAFTDKQPPEVIQLVYNNTVGGLPLSAQTFDATFDSTFN